LFACSRSLHRAIIDELARDSLARTIMADNKPPEKVSSEQPDPDPTPQTVKIYSNYAGVQITAEEFIIRFAERDPRDVGKATEIARVYVSLQHAKRLAIAMIRTIRAHEEVFGLIAEDPIKKLSPEAKAKLGIEETE
jgi:hypothetical protein